MRSKQDSDFERLGSALDATVGSLWQEMRETGEFPVDAGVDALRAWAFVIARMHDKSYQTQTTLMRRPGWAMLQPRGSSAGLTTFVTHGPMASS